MTDQPQPDLAQACRELLEASGKAMSAKLAEMMGYDEVIRTALECSYGIACHDRDQFKDKADAGDRFKEFVHLYVDQHGVPHGDPENQHQMEGCRIGARLDLMFAERDRLYHFARDCRDNWDCDSDAHKYRTLCRACEAKAAMEGIALSAPATAIGQERK